MQKKVKEEKEVTLPEVKEILEKRMKESEDEEELTYIQKITLDYVNKFSLYSVEDALSLKKELQEKFGLSPLQANQIVDLHTPPTVPEELDLIFDKSDTRFSNETKKQILELIHKYSSKYTEEEFEI
ncbi:MAG: RNA polymerase Rpb4 family protein [Candidatus Helarchaeales archaeon]